MSKHNCVEDCWDLRISVLRLLNLLEDRIGDLEHALTDAGIAIPRGRSHREREERIAHGKRILEDMERESGRKHG